MSRSTLVGGGMVWAGDHRVGGQRGARMRLPVFLGFAVACSFASAQSDPVYIFTTLAGQASTAGIADGSGAAARFRFPTGIAADAEGTIYVADAGNGTIRRISP